MSSRHRSSAIANLSEAPVEVEAPAWENASKRDGGGCGIGWWGHPAWLPGIHPNAWKTWYFCWVIPIIKINRNLKMFELIMEQDMLAMKFIMWQEYFYKLGLMNVTCSSMFMSLSTSRCSECHHFGIPIFNKFRRSTCLGASRAATIPIRYPMFETAKAMSEVYRSYCAIVGLTWHHLKIVKMSSLHFNGNRHVWHILWILHMAHI